MPAIELGSAPTIRLAPSSAPRGVRRLAAALSRDSTARRVPTTNLPFLRRGIRHGGRPAKLFGSLSPIHRAVSSAPCGVRWLARGAGLPPLWSGTSLPGSLPPIY